MENTEKSAGTGTQHTSTIKWPSEGRYDDGDTHEDAKLVVMKNGVYKKTPDGLVEVDLAEVN